jgi:hypothetical protein
MGKSSRRRVQARSAAQPSDAEVPVVGPREPCPCGSGKRYKLCHGRAASASGPTRRTFEGLPSEPDWVALREVVPAATAVVRLARPDSRLDDPAAGDPAADSSPETAPTPGTAPKGEITVATVLPLAWPALRRSDGAVFLGLQNGGSGTDPSRDLAAALTAASAAEPGTPVTATQQPDDGPRLQDLVDPDGPFEVTVHAGFDFWIESADDVDPLVRESLERANEAVVPTARLAGVDAAYWCRVGDRTHLRWVLPQTEDDLLDAIARLHAAGADGLGPGSRYVGAFRAHGLLVPVWDLPTDSEPGQVEEPAVAFAARLGEALAGSAPLTYEERRARAGVVSRQLTLS